MTEEIHCTNERFGKRRSFVLRRGDHDEFALQYRAKDRDSDPTFDELDLELEDFFVWVSNLSVDSHDNADAARNWTRNGKSREQ